MRVCADIRLLQFSLLVYSSSLDDGVQHVADCVVLTQNGSFDAADLALLFANAFFQVSQLVLQWLDNFFGDLLLFFELMVAGDCFFAPVFVLFAHAVDIVGHKVN